MIIFLLVVAYFIHESFIDNNLRTNNQTEIIGELIQDGVGSVPRSFFRIFLNILSFVIDVVLTALWTIGAAICF